MSKRVGFFGGRQAKRLITVFGDLGDMTGMTYSEIVKAADEPTTTQRSHDGSLIAVWTAGGISEQYSIALAFRADGTFVGIRNELHTKV